MKKDMKKDNWAIVLDFLPHGYYGMKVSRPVAQVLGKEYFSLLEVIVREDCHPRTGDEVYIGDAKRKEVKFIKRRIELKDLTSVARDEIDDVITGIIKKNPRRFLDFFNKAGPITTRLHKLELMPGVGKRHLWELLNARKEKEFESFGDIKKRVPMIPDPEKMILKRITDELDNKDKYRIFVPKFKKEPR